MYIYYVHFWYYNAVKHCKVTKRYQVLFDFKEYKIDIENWRTIFINDLKEEMTQDKATQFYIHKSGILPDFD